MFNKNDRFMQEIVFEVVENSIYQLEARTLSDNEKEMIVDIYNELELNDCPSVEDLQAVWNELYRRL